MNIHGAGINNFEDSHKQLLARASELKEGVKDAARIVAVAGMESQKTLVLSAADRELALAASELGLDELQAELSMQQQVNSELRQVEMEYEDSLRTETLPAGLVWDPSWFVLVVSAFVAAGGIASTFVGLNFTLAVLIAALGAAAYVGPFYLPGRIRRMTVARERDAAYRQARKAQPRVAERIAKLQVEVARAARLLQDVPAFAETFEALYEHESAKGRQALAVAVKSKNHERLKEEGENGIESSAS